MADAADSIGNGPFPGPAVSAWMGYGIVIRDSNVDPVDMLAACPMPGTNPTCACAVTGC